MGFGFVVCVFVMCVVGLHVDWFCLQYVGCTLVFVVLLTCGWVLNSAAWLYLCLVAVG